MELAVISLKQIVTMMLLMGVGVFCYKIKMIDLEMNQKLSNLVLMLVNPLVIFMSYQRKFEKDLLMGLLLAFGLAAASFLIGIVISHLLFYRRKTGNFEIETLASIYSNCGFIGIPLVHGMFGSEGVFYLTAYMTVFNLLVWTHGVLVMSGKRDFSFLKKAFLSSSVLATLAGLLLFLCHMILPEFISTPLNHLADMNTPLAMIVAGVSICEANLWQTLKKKGVYQVLLTRLILIPAMVLLLFTLLPVRPMITAITMVATACPTAATIILFSYRYEKDVLYASELFAVTTLGSMITIPLFMMLL